MGKRRPLMVLEAASADPEATVAVQATVIAELRRSTPSRLM
jgi:hypothetical protein